MKSTATISDAKVKHKSDYNGEKLTLNLVLSVDLPSPSEPQSINDWFENQDRGHYDTETESMRKKLFTKSQADAGAKKKGKAKEMPWQWKPPAALLEEELGPEYAEYVEGHRVANQRALLGAQEAGLFLLLIGKQVAVTIEPAQRAFADLLQLPALAETAGPA